MVDVCEGGLSKGEYLRRCARAWLTWSPEGYGWECLRHYEASLCLSVPVLSPPGILRHFPLQDRVHAIYYAAEGSGLRDAIWARSPTDRGSRPWLRPRAPVCFAITPIRR